MNNEIEFHCEEMMKIASTLDDLFAKRNRSVADRIAYDVAEIRHSDLKSAYYEMLRRAGRP